MRKVIAAINTTLDAVCDHTAGIPDDELHEHYAELLRQGDVALYGRTTYQLMQYWQTLLTNPSGEKTMDDFAKAMNEIPKLVFSHTLKDTGWDTATLANQPLEETVKALKQQAGGNILVGSRSLIIQLLNLNLIDELQLCVHPVVAGSGLPLFENIQDQCIFKLVRTKPFGGGAITLFYEPSNR